jgi:hypothetical protein
VALLAVSSSITSSIAMTMLQSICSTVKNGEQLILQRRQSKIKNTRDFKKKRNSCSGNDTTNYLKARGNRINTTPTAQSKVVFVRTRIVSNLAPTLECRRCSWLLRISRLRCWHVLHV